jgi:CO/xanthine dehydrogenase Mo-binding subunit
MANKAAKNSTTTQVSSAPVNVTNVSRRTLLKASLGIGGGLLLGFGHTGTRSAAAAGRVRTLNTYVNIATDGEVVIYMPTAEMGQGNYTALTKIVADELEADWSRVSVRLSHADPVFANPRVGRQRTANSDAVSGYFQTLREAGASGRDMLTRAAAQTWQVPVEECRASAGMVRHEASGQSLSYGELAERAAGLEPPASVTLKSPDEFRLIGRSTPKKDAAAKSSGAAEFGLDVQLPGMLIATVRHVPVLGAQLTGFNEDEILALPGVRAVVELDAAVAVVAETSWQALKAAEAVQLSWEAPAGAPLSAAGLSGILREALNDDAAALPFPKVDTSSMPPAFVPVDRPAAEQAFEAATRELDVTYEVPYLAHACMEPVCCTAVVAESRCEIWAPHQQPDLAVELAAQITGLPTDGIRLNRTFLGGGFGRKWALDFLGQSVTVAKALQGTPVKLFWNREEDIRRSYFRPAYAVRTRAAVDDDGRVTAMRSRIAGQSLSRFYDKPMQPGAADVAVAGFLILDAYDIDHQWIEYVERELPVPIGYWRAVTLSQNIFFAESAIDELAVLLEEDPYQFRRRQLAKRPRIVKVLDVAAEKADWGEPLPPGRGRGIAISYTFDAACAQVVEVSVENGLVTVERVTCAFDCGLQVDPRNIEDQLESSILFGLSAALAGRATLADGQVVESNFSDYRIMSMAALPRVDIHLVGSKAPPGGVGEAGVPAVMPALTGAIHAATGERIRTLPVTSQGLRVRM